MGRPKRQRKKFSKPTHPWQKERILAEKELLKDYGLRRKYEIWKMSSILKNFTNQAKNLITIKTQQSDKERDQLLTKLSSLKLIESNAKIEDVLSLTLKDVMERRLQTLVYKKNLAKSLTQARQFIVHEHVAIGDKTITAPSYLVHLNEENNIQFTQSSAFADSNHPERLVQEKKSEVKKEKSDKKQTAKETEKEETKKDSKPKKQAKKEKPVEEKKEDKISKNEKTETKEK
ncbi:30S ribosomal protein S4 [Candidatus Woesearchaeota archaeon]|jgi:small subunit ribosomal protein S4|nr:30S ribosomal protein S4 [Candidatus Woesearchaeota archaeon]|tara:strand:- start:2374 stop:3069 length:696 start_codon:yes stop_codon:yes gene_type:complete